MQIRTRSFVSKAVAAKRVTVTSVKTLKSSFRPVDAAQELYATPYLVQKENGKLEGCSVLDNTQTS